MQKTVDVLFALLRSELLHEVLSEEIKNLITPELKTALFSLSKKHDVAHLIADALDRNGFLDKQEKVSNLFLQERTLAVFRYERQNYELNEICRVLEEEKIEHVPLKGSVIRDYYDEPWKRTSCDIDVLVDKKNLEDAKTALVKKLGYTSEQENTHDVSLWAPSGVHLELHYYLVEDYLSKGEANVLKKVWSETVSVKGFVYRKVMTDEMFYFYHIQHMAKHFLIGGCGLRSFIDLWILNNKINFDKTKRNQLLKKGELLVFAEKAELLSEIWFGTASHTAITKDFEKYVLRGGVYGTQENRSLINRGKNKSKIAFFFSRVFLSYDELCFGYPKLVGRKWLYPFYTVKRWFDRLFKGRVKNFVEETKNANNLSEEEISKTKKLLEDLNLI